MKKGQVSLFIVVVAVIVILLGLGTYIVYSLNKDDGGLPNTGVPDAARPVSDAISNCLGSTLQEGVNLLNQQGGIINPELAVDESGNRNVIDQYGIPIQKWRYKGRQGIEYPIPTVEDMQQELEEFVTLESQLCFTNFTYDDPIIAGATQDIDLEIKRSQIFLTVDKPITINANRAEITLDEHKVQLRSSLLELYETAEKIVDAESNTYYLENRTMDLISVYDEIPFEGTEFTCGTKIWDAKDVEQKLKEAVQANIEQIKLKKINSDSDYYNWDIDLEKDQQQTSALFSYSTRQPMRLEITPSDGALLTSKATRGSGIVGSLSCVNHYKFLYSIQYPVLVKVIKDGEVFQFGMDVRIQNNQAEDNAEGFFLQEGTNEICAFAPKEIDVILFDTLTGSQIIPTTVQLSCGASTCNIQNNQFPQCVGSTVIIEADGYVPLRIEEYSTVNAEPINENLNPLYTLPVKVFADTSGGPRELNSKESAVIIVEGKDYTTTISYPEQQEIQLGAGIYEVSGQIFLNEQRTIKGGRNVNCLQVPRSNILGMIGITKEECVTTVIDDLELDVLIVGESRGEISLANFELAGSNEAQIFLAYTGIPRDYEDLQGAPIGNVEVVV